MESKIDPQQLHLDSESLVSSTSGLTVNLNPFSFIVKTGGGITLTPDNVGTLILQFVKIGPLSIAEAAQGWYDFASGPDQEALSLDSSGLIITNLIDGSSPPQIYKENFTIVQDNTGAYRRLVWDPTYSLTFGEVPNSGLMGQVIENDTLIFSYYRLGTSGELTPAAESVEVSSDSTASPTFVQTAIIPGLSCRARKISFEVSGTNLQLNGNSSVDFRINMNGIYFYPQFVTGMRFVQNCPNFSFQTTSAAVAIDGSNSFILEWRTTGGNIAQFDQLIFNATEIR